MEKLSYQELIIGFLIIVAFCVSVSVGYLSHKVDNIENKTLSVEKTIKHK